MKIECKFESEIIQRYVEGTIEPLEKIFLEEHIKVCRICKKELTEMKLLFWELENTIEGSIEVPNEISKVMERVIDEILTTEKFKYGIKEFINQQRSVMGGIGTFVSFIPGTEGGKKILKKAPSFIYRVSGKVFKGSMKIIHSRA